jgi:hypothetical protein
VSITVLGASVRRVVTAFAGLLATLAGGAARADSPTVRLVYTRAPGAESCADEETLRRAVARRASVNPFSDASTRTLDVRVAPGVPKGFVAHVSLADGDGLERGTRDLSTDGRCSELIDTVALAITIAVEPHGLARVVPPSDVPSTAPVAAPLPFIGSPHDNLFDRPTPVPPAPGPVAFEASAGTFASVGTAPAPSLGLDVGAALLWLDASAAVEGRFDLPSSASAQGGGSVSTSLLSMALLLCGRGRPWLVCGLAEAGRMQAVGEDAGGTRSSVPWWAAGVRVGAQVSLGRTVALRLRNDDVVDLRPATLVLNGATAWKAPVVAASLGVDVLVRFP